MTKKVGRPTVMTPETISKLEQAYAYGCTDEEACLFADIGRNTLDVYEKKHPAFRERKQALKNRPFLIARKSVIESMAKDGELALKYLERKMKKEFSLRQELEHSGVVASVNVNGEKEAAEYLKDNPEAKAHIGKIMEKLKSGKSNK